MDSAPGNCILCPLTALRALQLALALRLPARQRALMPDAAESVRLLDRRKLSIAEPETDERMLQAACSACSSNDLLLYHTRDGASSRLQQVEPVDRSDASVSFPFNQPRDAAAAEAPNSRTGDFFQIAHCRRKLRAAWMHSADETASEPFGVAELSAAALFDFVGRGPDSGARLHYDMGGGTAVGISGKKLWVAVKSAEAEQQGLTSDLQRTTAPLQRHKLSSWLSCPSFCWFVMEAHTTLFMPNSDWLHATHPLDEELTAGQGSYNLLLPALPQQIISWLRVSKSQLAPWDTKNTKQQQHFAVFMLKLADRVQPHELSKRSAVIRGSYLQAIRQHRATLQQLLTSLSADHVLHPLVCAMLSTDDDSSTVSSPIASSVCVSAAAPFTASLADFDAFFQLFPTANLPSFRWTVDARNALQALLPPGSYTVDVAIRLIKKMCAAR